MPEKSQKRGVEKWVGSGPPYKALIAIRHMCPLRIHYHNNYLFKLFLTVFLILQK